MILLKIKTIDFEGQQANSINWQINGYARGDESVRVDCGLVNTDSEGNSEQVHDFSVEVNISDLSNMEVIDNAVLNYDTRFVKA